ncbi:hypothetical protein FA15DRAFT_652713 [Coprinopsis marcescibilis]|uniref:Uncharacterized protein n=1 Tax=Coprinopsis marcescibilis TaxID=230819 RepID=A0A5C3L607_COPMA|nr:hypothetical protein FA15DRAFT_652713 [Coprinopsis marcescibilis]
MQTRATARRLREAQATTDDRGTVIVSPSATGRGIHTRWQYPIAVDALRGDALLALANEGRIVTLGEDDKFSYLFDGSLSSISSGSSAGNLLPITPRRLDQTRTASPSADDYQVPWTVEGGMHRYIIVPDDFSPEAATRRGADAQAHQQSIFDREIQRLSRQRDHAEDARRCFAERLNRLEAGLESECGDTDIVDDEQFRNEQAFAFDFEAGSSLSRHDTETSSRGRTPVIGTEGALQYPSQWLAQPSNALTNRPTDPVFF